jgi:predicted Zn-dependent protease
MKKYLIITILLLVIGACNFNDLKAMGGNDSLKNYEKMMEDMMKQLNPEEQKQFQDAMELAKDMKDKGMTGNVTTGDGIAIPPRQDKILSEVPTLSSPQQYNDYLAGLITKCKKNIESSIIAEVDELISKNSNNTVNLGMILLMQKKPVAAIYAVIKTAMARPEIILLQNNMAVILHQTGNPQISLPILHYLLIQNNNSLILNNLAQSYLSLGDTSNE